MSGSKMVVVEKSYTENRVVRAKREKGNDEERGQLEQKPIEAVTGSTKFEYLDVKIFSMLSGECDKFGKNRKNWLHDKEGTFGPHHHKGEYNDHHRSCLEKPLSHQTFPQPF